MLIKVHKQPWFICQVDTVADNGLTPSVAKLVALYTPRWTIMNLQDHKMMQVRLVICSSITGVPG